MGTGSGLPLSRLPLRIFKISSTGVETLVFDQFVSVPICTVATPTVQPNTPTPIPTAAAVPAGCSSYYVKVERNSGMATAGQQIFNVPMPACLRNKLNSIISSCSYDPGTVLDCAARAILGYGLYDSGFGSVPPVSVVAFDSNCNQRASSLAELNSNPACYAALFKTDSPISLVFSKDGEVPKTSSVVKFPLDPKKSDSWYEWKASAEMPLLVFDPDRTGKITSGKQLLGEWAFGGKTGKMKDGELIKWKKDSCSA